MIQGPTPVEAMTKALGPIWSLAPPGPDNLLQNPAFLALKAHCEMAFPAARAGTGFTFALSDALRALGLPCGARASAAQRTMTIEDAAARLVDALGMASITRRYLCPLDLADDLPDLTFGNATVRRYSAAELAVLFDEERLSKLYPAHALDSKRLSEFHWLVIEETVAAEQDIGRRALPFFYDLGRDLGEIDAHAGQYAPAVTDALFALLLAPWEDWHSMVDIDWRGFLVPWMHVETGDLFVRPRTVPSPDLLTWEYAGFTTPDGEEIEYERPVVIHLSSDAADMLQLLDHGRWDQVQRASATDLFSTPVKHFLVRAFFSDGMDQIMAHMTTIEAALGMRADFGGPYPPGVSRMAVKERLAKRIETLLGDPQMAADYKVLFELRSTFVHGRSINTRVPSQDRTKARRVARKVVAALIDMANGPAGKMAREDSLWTLG
ncbi:hypothetical protein [Novosphingobium percolationis]|uniref:hypothetical protein n=1 Tax=Novosphingobium percolationis TaxID=2871811 RepID=UPI001CD6BC80|nr:hypothetical protein [Novosphingobium percolationis]